MGKLMNGNFLVAGWQNRVVLTSFANNESLLLGGGRAFLCCTYISSSTA
jgi:hypothetical protein